MRDLPIFDRATPETYARFSLVCGGCGNTKIFQVWSPDGDLAVARANASRNAALAGWTGTSSHPSCLPCSLERCAAADSRDTGEGEA